MIYKDVLCQLNKNVQNSGVIGHGDDNNDDEDDLKIC